MKRSTSSPSGARCERCGDDRRPYRPPPIRSPRAAVRRRASPTPSQTASLGPPRDTAWAIHTSMRGRRVAELMLFKRRAFRRAAKAEAKRVRPEVERAQASMETALEEINRDLDSLPGGGSAMRASLTCPRPRASRGRPIRRRGSRRGSATSSRGSPGGDDPGESGDPEPPGLRLWRHPYWGSCTPNLLHVLVEAGS